MTEEKEGLCIFGIFILFLVLFIISGKFGIIWPMLVTLMVMICFGIYLFRNTSLKKVISMIKYYYLTKEEIPVWESIEKKAEIGFDEWFDRTNGDDICGPWIKDISKEEVALIDKIHELYYGKDWRISIPISTSQVCYVMYEDIRYKVKWN